MNKEKKKMKRNEENTSQIGGLSKGGYGWLWHTQKRVFPVEICFKEVQYLCDVAKKMCLAYLKKNRLSKTHARFCSLKQRHDFAYYPNWHACWQPWDQTW